MTVSAQTPSNSSTGNGVTTVFPYTFKIIANGDIEVSVDGVVQTLNTHYTVSGAGNNAGGNVTFLTAPAADTIVARRRNMALVRDTDYQYQGDLPASVLNPDLDAPVLMAQQLQEQISRSLRGPAGETWPAFAAAADRLDLFPVFNSATGAVELSSITVTQLASAVAAAYAAGSTADAVTYINSGTGAVSRTVQSRLRDIVVDDDFGTFAQAKTRADAALLPLLADPTVNLVHEPPLGGGEVPTNGYMRKGLMLGHMTIGNGPAGIDAMVGIRGDEYYTNVEQEVRGVSFVVRNTRTTPDESTLGWDFFGVVGVVTVEAGNTQNLLGNHKAVTGELYFNSPTSGSYTVTKAHNFQASAPEVGANVTVTNWYGLVVNSPTGSGAITTGYGLYIEAISLPTNKAAIRINGQADAGQIMWPNTSIKELATNKLQIDLGACLIFEDSSNRLNLSLNTQQLILNDALVATTVGASGAASALPAQPAGYWRVNIGGITRKIPYYTD